MVKSVCQARELNPGPSAFRAAALPLSYEAGMNLQGTTFEHALLLCELLVTLTAAGFAFKTGIFSHAAFEQIVQIYLNFDRFKGLFDGE